METNYSGQLAVIINSFNRMTLLKSALVSLENTLLNTPIESTVFIFEAGSSDGSIEFIQTYAAQSKIPVVMVYPGEGIVNTFSSGCNYAIEFASKHCPNLKWCFLYETDNYISNLESLSLALSFISVNAHIGAVGFTVEKYDSSKTGYGQKFPSVTSLILGEQITHAIGLLDPKAEWFQGDYRWSYCDIVFTSPLLVNIDAWRSVGGMDSNNFPFSDSDNDFCWRLSKSGWKCCVLDIPGVIHDNKSIKSSWSSKRSLNFHRARFLLLKIHLGNYIQLVKPLLVIRHFIELLILSGAYLIGRKKIENLKARGKLLILARTSYYE